MLREKNTTAIVVYLYSGYALVEFEKDYARVELFIKRFVKVIDDKEKICKKL